ncbi:FtsW/RodA/SpoVE family cell cycle protein [Ferrimicrobium acidiphilum]|uniref:FtsW/RodA/SpoVE family cell cycle protein n=1 Tax=Ferrimicrobium acidiphilum TaxID=121039 RepID=UPI0023F4EA76|nr:FtsW/RodA/SpoVE family cell cycle protein [Ferrimicrobium acidiphilum]
MKTTEQVRIRTRGYERRRRELELVIISDVITVFAWVLGFFGLHPNGHIALFNPWLAIVVVAPIGAHITNRYVAANADAILLPLAALLNGLGFVMIGVLDPQQGQLQALWTLVSIAAYVATMILVRNPDSLDKYRYLLAIVGIGLLFSPLVPGVGENIGGERLWVHFGTLSFQPVEIAKLLLAIFLASLIVEKKDLLARLRGGGFRRFGPIALTFGIALAIMAVEKDVGFALLIFITFVIVMWIGTGNRIYLLFGAVTFVLGLLVGGAVLPQVHQRITVWLDPWKYAATTGYQLIQAQYAFGIGGLSGTGLGLSHPTVPVATSDFIFAAFGQELGLLGTSAIIISFLLLTGAGIRIALRAHSEFSSLLAMTMTIILALQTFFILAGVIRVLPLTGMTLPFLAYGGSSLLANYILLAILVRISHRSNQHADPRESPLVES